MAGKEEEIEYPLFAKPETGLFLSICYGLLFLLSMMMLPLVGPSGSSVAYAGLNRISFLLVLVAALVFAMLTVASKMMRRKLDHSPLPYASLGVTAVCLFLLVMLLANKLSI